MKVLAILEQAHIRKRFVEIVENFEECDLTFCNPFTTKPAQVPKIVKEGGYDFIIYDFGRLLNASFDALKELRRQNPKTPILVFTFYTESSTSIKDAQCSKFYMTWFCMDHIDDSKVIKEAVKESRRLVA